MAFGAMLLKELPADCYSSLIAFKGIVFLASFLRSFHNRCIG